MSLTLRASPYEGIVTRLRHKSGPPAAVNEDRPPSMAAGLCKQAPSGRAGVRLRGLTWGVCSGPRRREAPCGKRPDPMSQESVLGVRPSTTSPDPGSIDPHGVIGN